MNNALVVFYSRTGYTQRVAERIAAALGADIEAIAEPRRRTGFLGILHCVTDVLRSRCPPIERLQHDPSRYPTVIVGSPVWAGRMASPVRSFLVAHAGKLQQVAFFVTSGGPNGQKVLGELASLAGHPAAATLALTDREIDAGDEAKPAQFVRALGGAADAPVGA